MLNSADAIDEIKEIKNISGRRSIRDGEGGGNFIYEETLQNRKNLIKHNEDRSISEPPQSRYINHTISDSVRLKTIREKMDDNNQCSSDEDFSKSNSQLNGSDLDLEIPDSASQTPTPTPLMGGTARRINSETNLNDSMRRLTGFMGNRSKRFCASTSELSFSSHLETNKSLFSPKNNRDSRSGSLYGSNMSLNSSNNSRLFMVNSPFYNGKTTFGGASAYPRKDINQHKILRNPIQMRPSSSLSNSSNTSTKSEGAGYIPESNAAKRILEVMAQFNGPLKETRNIGNNINSMIKIPGLVQNRKRFGEEDLQLNRSITLSRPSAPYSRPIGATQTSTTAATQKNTPESIASSLLNASSPSQIPTMAQLLKMKKLQNNTERAREIANRSDSFLNQVQHEYKLPSSNDASEGKRNSNLTTENNSSSSSFKMKNNITKNLLRNDKNIIDQPPEPLNLPNIQLPELKSYPKFDIKLPATSDSISAYKDCFSITNSNENTLTSSSSSPSSKLSTTIFQNAGTNEKISFSSSSKPVNMKTTTVMNKDNFKFSMPIIFDVENLDSSKPSNIEKFVFSKPLNIEEIEHVNNIKSSSDTKSHQQQSAGTDNLFRNLVAKQNTQWECDSCLTRNDIEKTKCLCCDTVKPGSEKTLKPKESTSNVFTPPSDDLFKKLAAQQKKTQWECDACMTKNDLDSEKCLCCETPKPGSKPASKVNASSNSTSTSSGGFKFGMPSVSSDTTKPVVSDDLFKSLAAQQKKSQWECESCMTRNDSEKEKCLCCDTPKPGSTTASKPQSSSSSSFSFGTKSVSLETSAKFSFGMPTNAATNEPPKSVDEGFKKILEKQNANWECSACMTRNEQSQSKCICCEQVKPGSSGNQASFSFANKSMISSKVSLPAPTEVKFSFGMPPVKNDTNELDKKLSNEVEKDQKKDEVDKPVSTGFSFGTTTNLGGFNSTENKSSNSELSSTFTFKAPASNAVSTSFTMPMPKAEQKSESTESKKEETPFKNPLGSSFEVKSLDKNASFNTSVSESKETSERPGGFAFSLSTPVSPTVSISMAPSIVFGSASTTSTASSNGKGGIMFGSITKTAEENKNDTTLSKPAAGFQFQPVSNSTSTGFSFGNTAVTSSNTSTTSAPQTQLANSNVFSFGAPKINEGVNNETSKLSFGSNLATSTISTFSPAVALSSAQTSVFGSSSTFVFGNAKKDENSAPTVQPTGGFSFSAKLPSSNMVFGNQNSNLPSITPSFGSVNSMPTFGSNVSNNTSSSNNNESGFGNKMNSFGNIQASSAPSNQPQKRTFDFSSAASSSSEGSQSKKFDFGSQQPQVNSAPFTFNAQPEQKTAFNFTASTPTFNFTANNNQNVNNTQENLFQFAANNSSTTTNTQGIFAFGANAQQQQPQQLQQSVATPPMMNFGAGATPGVAIGGLTAAFNPGTGGASPQRKILRANRRNVTRR